jgi:hypothetical protein
MYWRLQGFDSDRLIFEKKVLIGAFTNNQIRDLLRALTAKASLTYEEIVGAYAKRKTQIANDLLEVHQDGPYSAFSCGSNPHFVADVVDADGKVQRPRLPQAVA